MKQDQLDDTEVLTKKSKSMQEDTQVTSIETQGIRLKEFTAIMNNRRPKIFCLFIKLLTGENAEDYE